ncbi:MAG: hypothetical protein ACE5JZ_06640 [Kiloniellales bacterium]
MPEALKLQRVLAPQDLPLTLGGAKAFLKIEDSDTADEALIMAVMRAAVAHVETFTGRVLITQTWRLSLDNWPRRRSALARLWEGVREGADIITGQDFIEIPRPPLQSVTSFQIFDTSDAATEVDSSIYFVDTESEPGRVGLRFAKTWPSTTLRPHDGVQITFVAGYGDDGNAVPDDLMAGLRLLLAHFHEHRAALDQATDIAVPRAVKELLGPHRIMRV